MHNRICIIWRHGNVEIVHNFEQKLQTEILERKWVYSANCKIHINQRNWGTYTHKCLDDSQFGRNSHWDASQRESKTLIHACLDRQENYWMKVKIGKGKGKVTDSKRYFTFIITEKYSNYIPFYLINSLSNLYITKNPRQMARPSNEFPFLPFPHFPPFSLYTKIPSH